MKTGKLGRIVLWTLGSLAGLIILASVVLSFLDWNQYRGTLAELVSSRLGMRVELAGDIRLGILPRPSMSAESVRLLPAQEEAVEPVATAELIQASLGFGALLKGRLEVQHLGLKGIAVTLDERADGRIGLRGWPESEDVGEDTASAIQMDRLSLENSIVTILFADGTSRELDGINLELSGTLPGGPLEWQGSLSSAGERMTTSGKLRPASDGEAMSVKVEVGLVGGSADISGRIDDGGFTGRVQVRGSEVDSFASAAQVLATGEAGTVALPKLPFALDVQVDRAAAVTKVTSRTLSVGDTHGRLDLVLTPRQAQTHIGGTVSIGIIDTKAWLGDRPVLSDGAEVRGVVRPENTRNMPVFGAVDVTIEGVKVSDGLVQQVGFSAGVDAQGPYVADLQALLPGATNLVFSGKVGANMRGKGKLVLNSGNLPDLLRWVGYDPAGQVPVGRLATAELEAAVVLGERNWNVTKIKTRLDTTNVTGEIEGDYEDVWPLSVGLVADSINLDAYLPENEDSAPVVLPPTSLIDAFPTRPTRVSLLAHSVQWSGQSFENATTELSLSKAGMEVGRLDVGHRRGVAALKGRVKPVSGQWELDGDLSIRRGSFRL